MKKQKINKTRVEIFKSMGGNIPGGNFQGKNFPGGILMDGNFPGGNFPGENFLGPFSSHNISILIFQKMINKYNKTFNKKIYFKIIKCHAKFCATCTTFPSRNLLYRNISNSKHLKQWKV